LILPGNDILGANACYTEGAPGFCTDSTSGIQLYNASTSVGVGWIADGVFGTGTQVELTRSWSAVAYYQHIWNPNWRTSVYGGYAAIDYNGAINGSLPTAAARALCAPGVTTPPAGAPNFAAVTPTLGNSCNPDFSFWQVGSRTQWNSSISVSMSCIRTTTPPTKGRVSTR
jgi:Porin subfamily